MCCLVTRRGQLRREVACPRRDRPPLEAGQRRRVSGVAGEVAHCPSRLGEQDGAHRDGPALDDVRRWGERVREGGTLLIHDSFSSIGVTLALLTALFTGMVLALQSYTGFARFSAEGAVATVVVLSMTRELGPDEIDELLSLQGTGGPLTAYGVEHFVELIERKRRLKEQVDAIAGTEYLEFLEKLVGMLFEKIQPYGDRK